MQVIYIVLIGLFILAFILASMFLPKAHEAVHEAIKTEDYTYVKPKVIHREYTTDDIQEKKKVFEECLRNGMTPFDALKEVM